MHILVVSSLVLLTITNPSSVPMANAIDCTGTSDGTAKCQTCSQEHRVEKLRRIYEGCEVVDGNLELTFIDAGTNLTFLESIREVRGYVLVYHFNETKLSLPNLRVMRGDQLYSVNTGFAAQRSLPAAALHVSGSGNLSMLEFPQLTAIAAGNVVVESSPNLCYMDAIEWSQIIEDNKNYGFYKDEISGTQCNDKRTCNCTEESEAYNRTRCWGPDPDQCQKLTRSGCAVQCGPGATCFRSDGAMSSCCHSACLGGCYGPGTDQCVACRQFLNSDRCVDVCPALFRYDHISQKSLPNKEGRYYYGRECVKQCPAHMVISNQHCVRSCPKGHMQDRSPGRERICVECLDNCPTRCLVGDDSLILSTNYKRFENCTEIVGSLRFTIDLFKQKRLYCHAKVNKKYCTNKYVNVSAVTIPQLERAFGKVQVITGFLEVSLWHNFAAKDVANITIKSLSFLHDLHEIMGTELLEKRYSLMIQNTQFTWLGTPHLRRIKHGDVYIKHNYYLCFVDTLNWTQMMHSPIKERIVQNNRDLLLCEQHKQTCDELCDPSSGCWGPGINMCAGCRNWTIAENGSCASKCPESGYFANPDTKTCSRCHPLCRTCNGTSLSDCLTCRHYFGYRENACVAACSPDTYIEEFSRNGVLIRTCKPCNDTCAIDTDVPNSCTGPSSFAGRHGCNMCRHGVYKTETQDVICVDGLSSGWMDSCASYGYPNYYKTAPNELQHMVKHQVCKECDPQCKTCQGLGRNTAQHGCSCVNFLDQSSGDCVAECSGSTFAVTNSTYSSALDATNLTYSDIGTCIPCHEQCDGCSGPTSRNCSNCRHFRLTTSEQNANGEDIFECVENCPEGLWDNGDRLCSDEDIVGAQSRRHQVIQISIGSVLACVVLLLLIVAVSAYLYRRKARFFQVFNKGIELEPFDSNPDARPNLAKLRLITENELRRGGVLGFGAFGTVYKALWIPSGENVKVPVAIKVLHEHDPQAQQEMLDEAAQMASLEHVFLVRLVGVHLGHPELMLVSPLMPLGNLLEYVKSNRSRIGSTALLRWCYQISSGMAYLEDNHVVHRDLAARNVLVQTPHHVRISDFGLAKLLDYGQREYHEASGRMPIKWLALESIQDKIFTHKSDVWAFGVTAWEILTFGDKPYRSINARDVPSLIENGERLPQPPSCTLDVYMLMIRCWMVDSESRPSFTSISEQFRKMCKDPPRYLVIPGDKLLRLPSYSVADQKDLMREMITDADQINTQEKLPDDVELNIMNADDYFNIVSHRFDTSPTIYRKILSTTERHVCTEFTPNNAHTDVDQRDSVCSSRYCRDPTNSAIKMNLSRVSPTSFRLKYQASKATSSVASSDTSQATSSQATSSKATSPPYTQEPIASFDTDNYLVPNSPTLDSGSDEPDETTPLNGVDRQVASGYRSKHDYYNIAACKQMQQRFGQRGGINNWEYDSETEMRKSQNPSHVESSV